MLCMLGDEDKCEIMYGEEKYIVLGRLEQSRQDKNILYTDTMRPTNQQTKEGPFRMYSLSPHLPQFQQ